MSQALLESLLENSNWMRRLARSLVQDDSRADDVTQQALLVALERPPPNQESTRGWLSKVVRSVAFRQRRDDIRRARRERAAARDEAIASPDEAMQHMELHRKLVDLVFELREPFRSTLVLRYFCDLSSREIAARYDLPLATVRSRLQRALRELRGQLDRDFEGGWRAWTVALFSIGFGEQLSAAAKTGSGLSTSTAMTYATGVSSMAQTPFFVPVLMSLVVVAAGASMWSNDSTAEPRVPLVDWTDSPEYIALREELTTAQRSAISSLRREKLLLAENRELKARLSIDEQHSARGAVKAAPNSKEAANSTIESELQRLASLVRKHILIIGVRHDRRSLDQDQLAILNLIRAECFKASASARLRFSEPFFEPECFRGLCNALLGHALGLDEEQRQIFEELVADLSSSFPTDLNDLLAIEKYELRQETLDELLNGTERILKDHQRARWEVLRGFLQETLLSRLDMRLSIDMPTNELLSNWARNGLGARWMEIPVESIRPLVGRFLSDARQLMCGYALTESEFDALAPPQRAEIDARILDMQIDLEREAYEKMSDELRAIFVRSSPLFLRLSYRPGFALGGAYSSF